MRARGSARARTFGLLAMSMAAHIVVFSMLGLVPPPSEVLAMEDIEIEVMEPEPAKIEPEPEPEPPPPEPEPEPPPVRRAAAAAPEPEPEPEAAPPPEEVADFTGVTLTAEGEGAGWSTAVGSGAPLRGPVGKIGPRPEPVQQAAKAGPVGPRFVPVGSLARKPLPPAGLAALLERNYPRRARMQGIGGKARVMLRLTPNGRATDIRVIEEAPDGFGFAVSCVDTLRQGGAFSPAFDRGGAAVATEIAFNCNFEVDE